MAHKVNQQETTICPKYCGSYKTLLNTGINPITEHAWERSTPWLSERNILHRSPWEKHQPLKPMMHLSVCRAFKYLNLSLPVLFASWNSCHLIISNIQLPQSSQEGTCYEAPGASRLKIFRPLGAWKGEQKVNQKTTRCSSNRGQLPKELPKPRFLQQNWGDSTFFVPNSIQKHLEM